MNKISRFYVKNILRRLARARVKGIPFEVEGIKLLLDLTRKKEFNIAIQKLDWYELAFLASHYVPGTHFLDVGANIGFYSLYLAHKIPGIPVLAFEPDTVTAHKFSRHVELNGFDNITIGQYAIAESTGTRAFRIKPGGRDFDGPVLPEMYRGKNGYFVDVPCKTLLDSLNENGVDRVSIMKIDAGGYELPILRQFFENAPATIYPGAMVIECRGDMIATAGASPIELLIKKGYSLVWHKIDNFCFVRK